MKKVGLKWTPTVPSRRPDCIISSKARENGETGFIPSYERDRHVNMSYIMSNEYLRIWIKERTTYEIDTYSKYEVESGASDIKRRIIQRDMTKPNPNIRIMPIITLRMFRKKAEKAAKAAKIAAESKKDGIET